jgi:hypothetical protein
MQQSEISLDIPATFSSQEDSFELLIDKFFLEENLHKKNEIYRKIELAIIKNENINSAEINQKMADYFSKITEPNDFDKKLIKLMLTSGWKVPQDFPENDFFNIKEPKNDFYIQDTEIKIQDYKKSYETSPIKIEECHKKNFFNSLEIAFEYLDYCLISNNKNEVEYNKKNILRINVNGVELGFSMIGLNDFLKNIKIINERKELRFPEFVETLDSEKKQFFEENFLTLQARCILDKQMITDINFAKNVVENAIDIRSSIESSRRGSFQNFSSMRSSFQDSSSRRNSFQEYLPNSHKSHHNEVKILKLEGDKFVIKDPDPTCFSLLKSIFCNCFDKKNQQENIQRGRDQTPSSDHSLHPSSSFIVDGGLSLTSNRSDIFLN